MAQPRILTFNFHEPYLCLMAKTGLDMDVGVYESGPMQRDWHRVFRTVPPNLRPRAEADWRAKLAAGHYDVVIAHNEMNALDVYQAPAAKLLLCHNRRTFLNTTAKVAQGDPVETFNYLIARLQEAFDFVFISASKRDDYGVPGRVILPGIDLDEFQGYVGDERRIVRVGNTMRERDLMFDVATQEAACAGLPNRVVGLNADIPGSQIANSFAELQEIYRHNRVMLHVSREAFEDGYNLAMLEAMATGMPVVALKNRTCPITDGVDGYIGEDAEALHAKLAELLDDQDRARELGARGRETVGEKFSVTRFVENWRDAIFEAAEKSTNFATGSPNQPAKVLTHFINSPLTTGRYFEEALRGCCELVTAGMRMPDDVLRMWGFPEPIPSYGNQDVDVPFDAPYDTLIAKLPPGYQPDLYLYVDSGHERIEVGIEKLDVPKAAYLIDTHIGLEARIAMARHFDHVYLAQKAQVADFRAAGIEKVSWLPLACSPTLHDLPAVQRDLDVAYIGGFSTEEAPRRRDLLSAVGEQFPNSVIGRAWPEEMAKTYARAKIVVNAACNNDLNMRVFEALASGALLITDAAEGLEDLFEDGKHLVIYRRDEDLPELIQRYLDDDAARESIAAAGQAEVLAKHSYQHRVADLLSDCGLQPVALDAALSDTDKTQEYYECPRREIIPHVPLFTNRLLDVGCGAGALASTLKRERNMAEVAGIEIIESAWQRAKKVLDEVVLGSIEEMELPFPANRFDCIICADVLEHLIEPSPALKKLAQVLVDDGVIVISIPNIQFHEVIAMLSTGGWTYMDAGLLDSTHLRFYTKPTIEKMIRDAGLEPLAIQPLSMRNTEDAPLEADGSLKMGAVTIHDVTPEEHEAFRVYQYLAIAGKPGVDRLARARAALDAKEYDIAYAFAAEARGVDETAQRRIMGRALAATGKLAEAHALYEALIAESTPPEILGEFGALLIAMNRSAEALPHLEAAYAAAPDADRSRAALGLALISAGRNEEAWEHIHAALDANYEHIGLLVHYAALAAALNRWETAEPILSRFAEFYPANADAACFRAEALIALGRPEEAREALELTQMLAPDHARTQELLAQLGGA